MQDIKMADLTPMMQQYMETKKQYEDCILFYRLGDFYEMFFDDALKASKALEITLTGKSCGLEERAPMCGIPYHAVDGYLTKLVSKGYKVAICEQVEDPKLAKGIVKREVVRIVTPGTNLNMQSLEETKNNYLMCIAYSDYIGVSVIDVTTGDFFATQVNDSKNLFDEIIKFSPAEIICNDAFMVSGFDLEDLRERLGITVYQLDSWYFDDETCQNRMKKHFHVQTMTSLGMDSFPMGTIAAGAVLNYLYETQKTTLSHITHINPYITSKYMLLDSSTRRNLELCETLREKQKRGSLLWVLDKTKTAMGARTLRSYIEQPLIDKEEITKRLDAVDAFCMNAIGREEIREYLNPIYDLERLLGKVSYKSANPRDLIAFSKSLEMLPSIRTVLEDFKDSRLLHNIYDDIDPLEDICSLIEQAIEEEPPISIREGGIIKTGFHEDVDHFRNAKTEGKNWLAELELQEKERTGIKNLKIGYNKVFGYYFEVTNSYKELVPDDWIRKQTLTGGERYMMPKLKELEDTILNAEDKLYGIEYDLFCEIREHIADNMDRIQKTAKAVAALDVFTSLSYVAERNHYVRPKLNTKGTIKIKNGRHPVVEKMIEHDMFVSNDTYLDNNKNLISIITGPNMAGKSTYMRQTALIVLMAQIGSFVPADQADIGLVDRIFTRVGASDDLASGQSTFMVEMNEVANILRNATSDSLLILDEIGRGTSTFDGLAIAWAVIEHISNKKLLGAKTLFATHYHELTELEGKMNNVNNYYIAVKEQGDDIVFLRKILKGGADKSYGIQVAKLAGVPDMVIDRAKIIVEQLMDNDITERVQSIAVDAKSEPKKVKHYDQVDLDQISLFDTVKDEDILKELDELDISNLTPLDALNTLYRLQNLRKNRWHM